MESVNNANGQGVNETNVALSEQFQRSGEGDGDGSEVDEVADEIEGDLEEDGGAEVIRVAEF